MKPQKDNSIFCDFPERTIRAEGNEETDFTIESYYALTRYVVCVYTLSTNPVTMAGKLL